MIDDIYVGLGANLTHPVFGSPQQTLEQALRILAARGLGIKAVSAWYESAPVPRSDQPWFINGVARIETALDPAALLQLLNDVETELGRTRSVRNEPRLVDLDLLAYGSQIQENGPPPTLPHPRMTERGFVLLPLKELAPNWLHPKTSKSINDLLDALPPGQTTRRLHNSTWQP